MVKAHFYGRKALKMCSSSARPGIPILVFLVLFVCFGTGV
jgi:hypothetical protein